ncbi:MAG TPA: GDSL-type esterase/lipase family protein [Terracidiphilus sp.]|nr:GDSL-type esterase/lipase family protein [Terracidiphilus sp.]
MKRIVAIALILGPFVGHAQQFVCGSAQTGVVKLTATSTYTATAPGFDLNTTPQVDAKSCSSDKPFFFSVSLPEGSYRIKIVLGGEQASTTTVWAEARRLMLEKVSVKATGSATETFDTNVRVPEIAGDVTHRVKLKPREVGNLDWDKKLTLEFNGDHPSFRSISIEPIHEATIYLAGDSTVVDQDVEPWAAWGQMLPRFFRDGVVVANHAESGETIRSFEGEQRFAKVMSLIQPGDYLFMQFAHNDQKPGAVSLDDYKKLLAEYIEKTRGKGATPVLVTSMHRRTLDAKGNITNSLGGYPDAVREIAAAQHVALIDLNAMSKTLFEAMGPEGTLKTFMHYPANAFPNQTEAISDDTHFNKYGAYELARCVIQGIRADKLPIAKLLDKDVPDFNPMQPDAADAFNLPATPIPVKKMFVVNEYGAKGDGATLDTGAIQKAIDRAAVVGGTVTLEPGTYLSGSLFLKSGVTLLVPDGATIVGSEKLEDYPMLPTRIAGIEMTWPAALINVRDQQNVTITGKGTIDGDGPIWWKSYWDLRATYEPKGLRWASDYDARRPRLILIQNSSDIQLGGGILLKRSGFWTVQILFSHNVHVDGVNIRNNEGGKGPSTDGIDIDSSRKVLVEHADIDVNDDALCLKAGRDSDGLRVNRPTEDVVIRDSIVRSGAAAITIGSETSGGFRNIEAYNITALKGVPSGVLFKSAHTRGGFAKDIRIHDLTFEGVAIPVHITMNWNPSFSYATLPPGVTDVPSYWVTLTTKVPEQQGLPHFSDVHIWNIKATGAKSAFNVSAYPNATLDNFRFDHLDIEAATAGTIANSRNWTITDSYIRTADGSKPVFTDSVVDDPKEIAFGDRPVLGEQSAAITNTAQTTDPGAAMRPPLPTAKNPDLPTLYLVGDSTVRNGRGDGANGQWGWGEPLVDFFDASKINVVNRAIGGRSSRTYITEGRWDELLTMLKPGDFVVFQFGHNDSGPLDDTSRARGTLPGVGDESREIDNPITQKHEVVHTYGWYMRKYVADTLAKGAIPIVCSPIPRKIWKDGKVVRNAENYGGWARQVADSQKAAFVDLDEIIARHYDSLGEAQVEPLFADPHTHTSRTGAELNAECVVAGLKALAGNPLGRYLSDKGQAVSADSGH